MAPDATQRYGDAPQLAGRRRDNGDASQLAATLREVGDLKTDQSKARLYAKELLGLSKCLYVIEC